VVVAAEVQGAVDGGLGDVGAVRRADRDVAELARAGFELVEEHGRISASTDATVYSAQARAASSYDYSVALAAVENPVLVLQGLADRMTSPGGSVLLSRAIPGSELRMIEGVGHNLHIEMGERFVELVVEFLTRHDARWQIP